MKKLDRRALLRTFSLAAGGLALGIKPNLRPAYAAGGSPEKKPRFLIVVGAMGGASIIDSFLAIRDSESDAAQTVNTFPDSEVVNVPDSPFRAVDLTRDNVGDIAFTFATQQSAFANKHKNDMMVVTCQTTSVNHVIAQKRALNGNGAWNGRTLQEAVALEYGQGYLIPNVNMSSFGYVEHGTDSSVPGWALNEPIVTPFLWPLGLDGSRGLKNVPSRDLITKARAVRDTKLEPESVFDRTFGTSERLQRWRESRATQSQLEAEDAITNMNFLPDIEPQIPLNEFGLAESPDAAKVRAAFPRFATDPLESQCALAFLLLKHRVSVTVTISPTLTFSAGSADPHNINLPIAFDFSHQDHRGAQALMWNRILSMVDRLVDLLKSEEFDATTGESYWDRSLIYVATDFGRSKNRVGGAQVFGSGHDLNNGYLIVSPLANGNKVIGGVNPDTALTFGADRTTGAPAPGTTLSEADVFSGILGALEVDTSGNGLTDVPAMRRA